MSDGEDRAMTTAEIVAAVDEHKAQQKASEAGRVVLRGVQVIVLDDLLPATRAKARELFGDVGQCEAWIVESAQAGTYDDAILNAAGDTPGKYRAVKVKAWREQTPRHIEPPLS